MAYPQPGLLAQGLSHHQHVELRLRAGVQTSEIIECLTAGRRAPTWVGAPNVVWGFGPDLWRRLAPDDLPPSVHGFQGIVGKHGLAAPATQSDIWAWCSSFNEDDTKTAAAMVVAALLPVADLEYELAALSPPDGRDPTGFIDGTENPLLDEGYQVAIFPEGTAGAGGSDVLVQKWVHKLAEFQSLAEREQEAVMGRTLLNSVQLDDDVMPLTSHVKRNTVFDQEGQERHILRRNTPFTTVEESGTQFIGCTNDPGLMDIMLNRMFGVTIDGLVDRLAEFSTPVTGSYYFVPSVDALTQVFGPLKVSDEE